MTEQTRGTRRIASNQPLQLRYADWGEFVRAYARDISSGGMFIQTEQTPPILSSIDIDVKSPDGEEIRLNARVVHIVTREQVGPNGTPGIGVEFQNVTSQMRQRLAALMNSDLQRPQRTSSGVHSMPTSPASDDQPPAEQPEALITTNAQATAPTISAKDEKAMLLRLTAELAAMGQKTDHQVLGVDQAVGEAGVRAAFVTQSRIYHPDLFAQYATPDVRPLATQIFVRIKRAYSQLMKRVQQRDPGAAASNLARALGGSSSATSDQRAALNALSVPTGDTGSVVALIADARRHVAHKRYEEAQRTLEKALGIDPNHRDVKVWFHTVRARRLKLSNEMDAALEQYRLVLGLDEKNLEATKELRSAGRPSLFTDLKAKKG